MIAGHTLIHGFASCAVDDLNMEWAVMYGIMFYVVFCADDVAWWDEQRPLGRRILRAIYWPVTVTGWFRTQNARLHRLVNIVWALVITSWFLTLLHDRIFS